MPLPADEPADFVAAAELIARRLYERGQASSAAVGCRDPMQLVPIYVCYVELAALVNILAACRAKLSGAPEGATLQ